MTVNTSNLERKLKNWKANLLTLLRSEWQQIALECLADIAGRAPNEAQEYTALMGGSYDSVTSVPSGVGRNASAYPYSGDRVHFDRAPGMWVKEAVLNPSTWSANSNDFTLSFGFVSALEASTRFSWTNFSRKSGSYPHTSEYGIWSFFEYGLLKHIKPRNWSGDTYKLKPEGAYPNQTWQWDMDKQYPRLGMYSDFDPAFLRQAIATRLRAVRY